MIRTLIVAAALVSATLAGGCSLTTPPLHSELSDAELDFRLRTRFARGMSGTEAIITLNRAGLEHTSGAMPPRDTSRELDRGVRAMVPSPDLPRPIGPPVTESDTLYLWFGPDGTLDQIGYERSTGSERPERAAPEIRVIPLAEEPNA